MANNINKGHFRAYSIIQTKEWAWDPKAESSPKLWSILQGISLVSKLVVFGMNRFKKCKDCIKKKIKTFCIKDWQNQSYFTFFNAFYDNDTVLRKIVLCSVVLEKMKVKKLGNNSELRSASANLVMAICLIF